MEEVDTDSGDHGGVVDETFKFWVLGVVRRCNTRYLINSRVHFSELNGLKS